MAYFNHAFHKVFLGSGPNNGEHLPTGVTTANMRGGTPGTCPTCTGYINVDGVPSVNLTNIQVGNADATHTNGPVGPGYFGVFSAATNLSIGVATVNGCCPFYIAASPIFQNDRIGPYAGGYRESNKSKIINPRYVRQFYRVDACLPAQSVISIGYTPGTIRYDLDPLNTTPCEALDNGDINGNNFQGGTTCANCNFNFLCGETYYLRVDVKGSPALRFLNHQAYQTVSAYTGCCDGPTPTVVDPTTVFIQWATAIHHNPYVQDLIFPVVYDTAGTAWYPPNVLVTPYGETITQAEWWTNYVSPAGPFDTSYAGMRLFGAYVETKFGNCTFQVTDFYETEPVKILASMVDYTGDPCTFEGICVYTDCYGMQGMGYGEKVLRDLIVSESYLQNYVGSGTDMRIREITQGYDIINSVNRVNGWYTRYFILHSVPRYNNPSGVFDNDQYLLEIVVGPETQGNLDANTPVGNPLFEDAMDNILGNCPDCLSLETRECIGCDVAPDPEPVP